jgi:dephospho-CoA kinase
MMNNGIRLIGLRGLAGSGKDTTGKYLCNTYNFKKLSFGQSLKDICAILSGWPIELLNGESVEHRMKRETLIHPIYGKTPRGFLQYVGTDLLRNQIHPDILVNIIDDKLKILNNDISMNQHKIVITDVRFANEVDLINKYHGQIVTIKRPNININTRASQHASEQLFNIENDTVINNNGSIEDLFMTIEDLIEQKKIVV